MGDVDWRGGLMWRSVLLHEFLNEGIRSLRALPGSLTFGPIPLSPRDRTVQIAAGRGFRYILRDPIHDVIGVSCRTCLRCSLQDLSAAPIVRLGDAVELLVQTLPAPNNA